MAALMHDLGKVRPLGAQQARQAHRRRFAIEAHTVDGAEMLRRTPDIPTLAPVVAFEHHLRLGSSGYPHGVKRPTLNICTAVQHRRYARRQCDRSAGYQQSFPTDRFEVLKRSDASSSISTWSAVRPAHRNLSAGNMVRLSTGGIAVFVKVYARSYRPQVRVLFRSAPAHGSTDLRRESLGGRGDPD